MYEKCYREEFAASKNNLSYRATTGDSILLAKGVERRERNLKSNAFHSNGGARIHKKSVSFVLYVHARVVPYLMPTIAVNHPQAGSMCVFVI